MSAHWCASAFVASRVAEPTFHINFTVQRRRYRWKMRRMRACYRWRIVGVAVMSCSCGGAVRSVSDARASCPWHHRPPRAPGHRYTSRARRATRHTRSRSRERARCSVFWSAVTVIRVRVSASYPAKIPLRTPGFPRPAKLICQTGRVTAVSAASRVRRSRSLESGVLLAPRPPR